MDMFIIFLPVDVEEVPQRQRQSTRKGKGMIFQPPVILGDSPMESTIEKAESRRRGKVPRGDIISFARKKTRGVAVRTSMEK